MIEIVLLTLLNVLTPWHDWHVHAENQTFEGERTWCVCAWRYQRPPLMCFEVPR